MTNRGAGSMQCDGPEFMTTALRYGKFRMSAHHCKSPFSDAPSSDRYGPALGGGTVGPRGDRRNGWFATHGPPNGEGAGKTDGPVVSYNHEIPEFACGAEAIDAQVFL